MFKVLVLLPGIHRVRTGPALVSHSSTLLSDLDTARQSSRGLWGGHAVDSTGLYPVEPDTVTAKRRHCRPYLYNKCNLIWKNRIICKIDNFVSAVLTSFHLLGFKISLSPSPPPLAGCRTLCWADFPILGCRELVERSGKRGEISVSKWYKTQPGVDIPNLYVLI